MDVSTKLIVEGHVSEIMKHRLEIETTTWHRKLGDCCTKSYYICTNLNVKEESRYGVVHMV